MKVQVSLLLLLLCSTFCYGLRLDIRAKQLLSLLPYDARLAKPESPGKDISTCGGLWGKTGFMCKKSTLIEVQQQDLVPLNNAKGIFTSVISLLLNVTEHSLNYYTN